MAPFPVIAALVAVASFAVLFGDVARSLVSDWATDDNFSHGFLVVPLALYFAWERRSAFRRAQASSSWLGLALVLGSLGMLTVGRLGAEYFLTRVALIGTLAGAVLFVGGWARLRVMAFPIAFLILMVPIPALLFNQVAFPLQLLASDVGASGLKALGIPVLREGNVMMLAHTTLEVAEACSGIRSLISLLTLGIVYGYFMDSRSWVRWTLAFATVPIAVVTNGLRVAGTGVAAHHYGAEAAEGFMHSFSGWLVFVAAFVLLVLVRELIVLAVPERRLPLAAAAQLEGVGRAV
jgi:exosortase